MRLIAAISFTVVMLSGLKSYCQSAKPYSIIIGVDRIDEAQYSLNKRASYHLRGSAQNEVDRIQSIASKADHEVITLVNQQSTRKNILDTIKSISKLPVPPKIVFIYFIGYGESVYNRFGGERNGMFGQTFLAYDDLLFDNSLYEVFDEFHADKLTVLFSDIIHYRYTFEDNFLYFLDFAQKNEGIATPQRMNVDCVFQHQELVDEKAQLIYFGVTQDTTSNWDLSSRLYSIRRAAKKSNRLGRMTYRAVACKLADEYRTGRVFFYKELGLRIEDYKENLLFK